MVSDSRWREFLEYVEWRARNILSQTSAYERGRITDVEMWVGVSEDASKLLRDVQELLRAGPR